MTLISVLIKIMDILIPRAERCVGFLSDSYAAGEESVADRSCMYVLKESDKDAGDRLLSQLEASGVPVEQTSMDRVEALYKAGHSLNIMYKVPPMKNDAELYDEVSRCGEIMGSRNWNEYMHNELLNRQQLTDMFMMPSCMLYNTKQLLTQVLGIHDSLRPHKIVALTGNDWFTLDTSRMILSSDLSDTPGVTTTIMANSMVQIPWVVRLMLQLIRRRTYYVLATLTAGCRSYDMMVYLPVAPSTENMADVACRYNLLCAAGENRSLAYTPSISAYQSLGVWASRNIADQVSRMFNMISWYVMKEDQVVKQELLHNNQWFRDSEPVLKLLESLYEPGASEWYKRPLYTPKEVKDGLAD